MSRLPSYVKRGLDKTYYIRFKLYNCIYEVKGFTSAMAAIEHKIWLESQLLNGADFKQKIIKNSLS